MRMPSKVTSYNESTLPKMVMALELLEKEEYFPAELYKKMKKRVKDVGEFVEIIDCLYILGRVDFDPQRRLIYYVKEN